MTSNWYMVMAALAWTLKAWFALLLPETGRWAVPYAREKQIVLRMEFKAFLKLGLIPFVPEWCLGSSERHDDEDQRPAPVHRRVAHDRHGAVGP